jgi:Ca-activated chloride channel family protein
MLVAHAQSADDFFHGGAQSYISNNIANAKEEVDRGLKLYPGDLKLKKLEDLLNQQSQQQQSQQNQRQQQSQQQSQQQQQNQQQPSQSQKSEEQKQQQQAKTSSSQPKDKSNEKERDESPVAPAASQMTPQEAQQLLDAEKGDEMLLQFKPEEKAENRERPFKDW